MKRHFPYNILFQEFPGTTFREEMDILKIYNNINKNYYLLVSLRDNETVDGDEVYHTETTNMQELIKFDTEQSCWSEIRKIGDDTIRSSQRVDVKEIRKQWSSYNDKTGEIKEGGKYVTVSTASIMCYIYKDVVMENRHYRYQRVCHFKKVRRSKRKKNVRKEILLPLMYC